MSINLHWTSHNSDGTHDKSSDHVTIAHKNIFKLWKAKCKGYNTIEYGEHICLNAENMSLHSICGNTWNIERRNVKTQIQPVTTSHQTQQKFKQFSPTLIDCCTAPCNLVW